LLGRWPVGARFFLGREGGQQGQPGEEMGKKKKKNIRNKFKKKPFGRDCAGLGDQIRSARKNSGKCRPPLVSALLSFDQCGCSFWFLVWSIWPSRIKSVFLDRGPGTGRGEGRKRHEKTEKIHFRRRTTFRERGGDVPNRLTVKHEVPMIRTRLGGEKKGGSGAASRKGKIRIYSGRRGDRRFFSSWEGETSRRRESKRSSRGGGSHLKLRVQFLAFHGVSFF